MDDSLIQIVLKNRAFLKTILRTQAQLISDIEKRVKDNVMQLLYIKVDEYTSSLNNEYEEYTQNDRKLLEVLIKNTAYLKTTLRTLAQVNDHLISKKKGIITQVIFSKVDNKTNQLLAKELSDTNKETIILSNQELLDNIIDIQIKIISFLEDRNIKDIRQILNLRINENYEAFLKVNEEQSETVKNIIKLQIRNQAYLKAIIGTLSQVIAYLENRNKIEFLQALSRRVDEYTRHIKNILNVD